MNERTAIHGRNFFCGLTGRAARIRWRETTLSHKGTSASSSDPKRARCMMTRSDCPRTCKHLGGHLDPERRARNVTLMDVFD